jgi:catechol 2,3-dioxygenase-like lactoylglutathione lyase family enzyme
MLRQAAFMGFIPVRDLGRARSFYVDILGLTEVEETPAAVVVDANSTVVRLTMVGEFQPLPFTIGGWQVNDIEAEVDALVAAGVPFQRYEGMEQDDRGVWTTPGGDRVAWFRDPDGNTLSLTSFARKAI